MTRRTTSLVVVLGVLLLPAAYVVWRGSRSTTSPGTMTPEAAEAVARAYLALEAQEQAVAEARLGPELDAERYEDSLIGLWDSLNATTNSWEVLSAFPVNQVFLPEWGKASELPHGIQRRVSGGGARKMLDSVAWNEWLKKWTAWSLTGSHWSLVSHRPAANDQPAHSTLRVAARLENTGTLTRAVVRARVGLTWASDAGATPTVQQATIEEVDLLTRTGPPPFRPWMEAPLSPDAGTFNDPLIVRDLTGDGRPEILLVGANEVWINDSVQSGPPEPFRRQRAGPLPSERIQAAVMADVDGDHREELVVAGREGIQWLPANPAASWGAPQSGWKAAVPLKHPQAITAGDVDGDGDVDLWLVQYKLPYQQGQFPTPWYDARDGFPSYLLLNDGRGGFTDGTGPAGLDPLGSRRSYGASLVDLDLDGDLDLVNVSDFAGLDLWLNDGGGHFQDATATLGDGRHGFGMSQAINDLNGDGRADLLMLGMDSTVASRWAEMGLIRRTPGEEAGKVPAMAWGNRLYLGDVAPGAPLTPVVAGAGKALASTGWTWGAAWEDFDHDGRLDLAVANGHETRASTADYERQFWKHDRFVAGSTNSPAAEFYFRTAAGRRQAAKASYGGWQDNEFRLNLGGDDFPDVAWLLGLAVPADSRNLVAADLDFDGRLDLVMTTQEGWPRTRQRLLVFRNEMSVGDWIGFRFEAAPPPGTRVELELPGQTPARWLVTGDGFRSQGPLAVHFGLGSQQPSSARIHWPQGNATVLDKPTINQWHVIQGR